MYLMNLTKRAKDGRELVHVSWEARSPLGVSPARKKSFSVKKFGYDKAYELAVSARKAFVAELDGYLLRQVPEKYYPPQ